MNFFDWIKSLYLKTKIPINEINVQWCIVLSKWLAYDQNNLLVLKKIVPLFYWLHPQHYYYLLFFNIKKQSRVPFLKKITKTKTKDNILLNRVTEILGWSTREQKLHKEILEELILPNKKYWKAKLGIK